MGRAISSAVGDVAGAVGGAVRATTDAVGGATSTAISGITAISTTAASVAQGIGAASSLGIGAAQTAFESAAAQIRGGLEQGLKSGVGPMGLLPPPGHFISQLAQGAAGELAKEIHNAGLDPGKQAGVFASVGKAVSQEAGRMAAQQAQKEAAQLQRLMEQLNQVMQRFDDFSSEMTRNIRG